MLDPVTTPLLILVLGNLAQELITDACKDHLKDKLKSLFGWLSKVGEKDKVESAYQDAMEQAYAFCLEMLLLNIKGCGYSDDELKQYESSLKAFIKDEEVADELLTAVREPGGADLPSPERLRERWNALAEQDLPSDALWTGVAVAFRRQASKEIVLSDDLRDLLNAQNLQELKEMIERQGGVKVPVRLDKYSKRMRTKFSPVDLANLMPAYAEDPGRLVIRDVFVPQNARENPLPIEIPKDLAKKLRNGKKKTDRSLAARDDKDLDEEQIEKLRTSYVSRSPKQVLDIIAAPSNRLLVLTGDPGSGKSTLMRYLLTGVIEPPVDAQTGEALPWTLAFKEAFPLLIELRDFYALRRSDECDSFLEYLDCMGKTEQWFLDQQAVHGYLEHGQSLVMFDGLDEIFDTADRERVMQEIAGFAQRYPKARIIVTSRSVGYKEQVLRNAGFAHFGIQDLDDNQVELFIRGWFALTLSPQAWQATQRIERVLHSVEKSKPIKLLAGNPMLLTIMALLAREEELPRERAKFYEKAVEVLCHHWDANRNLELPEDRYLSADDKKGLLRRIAMRMQAGEGGLKGNFIAENDLEKEIQAFLIDEQWQTDAAEAKKASRRMMRQLRERNYILCLRGPKLYGFVHRTFLEYLTAAEYVQRFDRQPQQMTIEELIALFEKHCRDDEWREVLRLICGQIDEQFVGQIVEDFATQVDYEHEVSEAPEVVLAIECLSECRNLTKIELCSNILCERIVHLFQLGGNAQFFARLISAAEEIGTRWPQSIDFKDATRIVRRNSYPRSYAARCWARFVAIISADQSYVRVLADDSHARIREGALVSLAKTLRDDATRTLLIERASRDENEWARSGALEALANTWTDESTRELLTERAVEDEADYVRRFALEALAEKWPDEATRKLLRERAVQDDDAGPRCAAFRALAAKWPDDDTRTLLTKRAVEDAHEFARRGALSALAETWPDGTTLVLLAERVVYDHCAAWIQGGMHSRFGQLVFTRNAYGSGRYRDPAKSIAREHIEKAAEKAGIAMEEVDETVRSLSEHMGWDITKGFGTSAPDS